MVCLLRPGLPAVAGRDRNKCSVFEQDECIVECVRKSLTATVQGENTMSKGMNSKKQTQKTPAKTMLEKRAAKKAKKAGKGAIR